MKITKKAEKYSKYFITDKRNDGAEFVKLTDNAPKELIEAVRKAHGDRLPDDWVYGTFADLMQKVSEYELDTIESLEDVRSEIVDSYVDVYTHNLTGWLHEDINNVYYITQALEEFGQFEDGFKLLATAQYMAIDEVMQFVIEVLE